MKKKYKFKLLVGAVILVTYIVQNGFNFGDAAFQNKNSNKKYSSRNNSKNYSQKAEYSYLTLVLSWSPTFCQSSGGRSKSNNLQCNSSRPYGFVLHGLWPQHEKGYPEYCEVEKGVSKHISKDIVSSMLDIMPAPSLIKHEYKKHGTCMGGSPKDYYDVSRKLYKKLNFPKKYSNLSKPTFTTAKDIRDEFLKLNPSLKANMFAVNCSRGNQNRLKEIKVCFDKSGEFRTCGKNEKTNRLCQGRKVLLPPMRG